MPLQVAVFFQLADLFGQGFRHGIKADGQAGHFIFAVHHHAFPEVTCGEALGNAAGGSHGSGDLLGGQPGDAHEQHNQAHATGGEQATHEGERGFFVVQGHDQVKL